jgi:ribonuclease HI
MPMTVAPTGRWTAFCDGSAAPNPGRMAYGAVLVAPDGRRHPMGGSAGAAVGCNNEAELWALTAALQALQRLGAADVLVYSDNSVVVAQLARPGPAAAPAIARLAPLFDATRALLAGFERVELQWIPRHRNAEADALCRAAAGLPPKPVLAPGPRRSAKKRMKRESPRL